MTAAPRHGHRPRAHPVAAIVLPSSPALPDGDVDPALVEAAIAAAADTAPAKPAAATAKARPEGGHRYRDRGTDATEGRPNRTGSTTAAAGDGDDGRTPAEAAAPAATARAAAAGTGHGGRLDLQVQAAPRRPETAPAAAVETTVAIIDRERVERLADGLAARLKVSHAADGARIRMQLEPRELGEVVVRLEIRNGMAHAHLIAESADARRALQASLADLRTLARRPRPAARQRLDPRRGRGRSNARRSRPASHRPTGVARAPLSFGRIDAAARSAPPPTSPTAPARARPSGCSPSASEPHVNQHDTSRR